MNVKRWFCVFFISVIPFAFGQKIKGLSFVGTKDNVLPAQILPVQAIGANWVTLMPFGYLGSLQDSSVHYDTPWQWKGETTQGITKTIPLFNKKGIKVMLKPQLWVRGGKYTGKIEPKTAQEWERLKTSYRSFILHFAAIAQNHSLPLFCIGTELSSMVQKDPDYWRALIRAVRERFKGELVYAENWDQYQKVPFWDALDYIGVNAYFPLKGDEAVTLKSIQERWQKDSDKMAYLSKKTQRPILFTEMGYRSIPDPLSRPWDYRSSPKAYDPKMQAMALEALFKQFISKQWWKGGFVWKWFPDHQNVGGENHTGFSPQNKLAQDVLHHYFTKQE